jgi:hypothetical protein
MTTSSAFSLTQEDWKNYFKQNSLSKNLVPYWTDGLYKNRDLWRKHLSESHINFIQSHFSIELPRITRILESNDGTYKFQISFNDGLEVESVLIPFHKRYTICLSTQVGCAMNCSFCFTGTQGLKRNLEAGEIVTQYLIVKDWLKNKHSQALLPNIVFMGQGEPLHNFVNVKKAIEVAHSRIDYLEADPLRNAQNGIKVLLKFLLMERQRIKLSEVPKLLNSIPLVKSANQRHMNFGQIHLAHWAITQLRRAGALDVQDNYLVDVEAKAG